MIQLTISLAIGGIAYLFLTSPSILPCVLVGSQPRGPLVLPVAQCMAQDIREPFCAILGSSYNERASARWHPQHATHFAPGARTEAVPLSGLRVPTMMHTDIECPARVPWILCERQLRPSQMMLLSEVIWPCSYCRKIPARRVETYLMRICALVLCTMIRRCWLLIQEVYINH